MNDQPTLLNRIFGFADDEIVVPDIRIDSQWTDENKHGFLSGIAEYGLPVHKQRLTEILQSNLPLPDRIAEIEGFIEMCFDFYITTFKQHGGNSCHTPSPSRPPSRSNSAHNINEMHIPELSHSQFKKYLSHRDKVCLFCWMRLGSQAAHIVDKKDLPFKHDEQSIGLESKHQVQNGMLLCSICHGRFDMLKLYHEKEVEKMGKTTEREI